jgi:hypothetical protein
VRIDPRGEETCKRHDDQRSYKQPKHGSWLNLIEGFFSKFARSVLRHIRVASKQELKERITAGIKDVNRYPVIHTWSYKLAEAA